MPLSVGNAVAIGITARDHAFMSEPRRLPDVSSGLWVNDRLLEHRLPGCQVGTVVPTGFDHAVRVLHPAGDGRTWGEVAAAHGRKVHPMVQWGSIAPHFDGTGRSGDVDPEEGSIPADTLAAILEHCPTDHDVTYGVWVGFGSWADRGNERALLPGWGGRDYLLFEAPKAPLTSWPGMDQMWPQSANLIWPQERSWCIATEIDWDSTLIAGSFAVTQAILADERLEAFEVAYDDDLSWHGDQINPRPKWLH